tara:strand:- start:946 stop:1284 length:339 start_codon:yes stop_codon:yes gene_type:complete
MTEVSTAEICDVSCVDSPYPFTRNPNLVSVKMLKKLQLGGNIETNFFKDNLVFIIIIGLVFSYFVYKYFVKRNNYLKNKDKKENTNIKKVVNKNSPLMKSNKEDFMPINSYE